MPSDNRETLPFYRERTFLRSVATLLGPTFFSWFMDIKITGREHIPPTGPVVLVANHITLWDMFPMQIAMLPRDIFFMAKSELFYNPTMNFWARQAGAFPVRRGTVDQWALKHALTILREGKVLGVFPEGTRNYGKGLKVAKGGAARLAMHTQAPLLPMTVAGTEDMLKSWRRAQVTITFSPAIYPHADDTDEALTERFMQAIAAHLPEKYLQG